MIKFVFSVLVVSFGTLFASAQYGEVNDLGSGNAGVRVAAFNGSATIEINGSNRGRVGNGDVSDVMRVQVGSASFSGSGASLSTNLQAGKTYMVAYVGGRPVGSFELSDQSTARSESSVILINATGTAASFLANGADVGRVSANRSSIVSLPPSRTVFEASGESSNRISLRRGRVSAIILTDSGFYSAS